MAKIKHFRLRYLSLFSGIEAATVAWDPLGWEPVAFSEVEAFPNAVLAHHYPEVPNLGDITQITEADVAALGPIDIVVFGSPCQDLSVAGQRKGLDGERSHLFFNAMDVVRWARKHCGARWALWENVPGALSSRKGADFGAVVGAMAGTGALDAPKDGWGKEGAAVGPAGMVEWSVLDAQWFGVAQRRRRVFALLDLGDWAYRPPVLLEPESLRGDSAPSREPGEGVAGAATQGVALRGREGGGTAELTGQVQPAIRCGGGGGDKPHALIPFDTTQITSKTNRCQPRDGSPCHPLAAGAHAPAVAYGGGNTTGPVSVSTACNAHSGGRIDFETETFCVQSVTGPVTHALSTCNNGKGSSEDGTGRGVPTVAYDFHGTPCAEMVKRTDVHTPLRARTPGKYENSTVTTVQQGMAVRRLTPRECERLQGFPDDYTAIPWRGKPASGCPDGPRYKALGNSMAVPVVRWIGEKIELSMVAE